MAMHSLKPLCAMQQSIRLSLESSPTRKEMAFPSPSLADWNTASVESSLVREDKVINSTNPEESEVFR
jgi:hypothetical protein